MHGSQLSPTVFATTNIHLERRKIQPRVYFIPEICSIMSQGSNFKLFCFNSGVLEVRNST